MGQFSFLFKKDFSGNHEYSLKNLLRSFKKKLGNLNKMLQFCLDNVIKKNKV